MKLSNARQIRAEDFPKEAQDTVSRLGDVLNSFMQEVVELSNKRVDFDNKTEVYKIIDISVDSNGKPISNDRINAEKTGVLGFQVISAFNLVDAKGYPTTAPFISYTPISGTMVQINNISGLVPNQKYRLALIIY